MQSSTIITLLILIALAYVGFNFAKIKGSIGEKRVIKALKKLDKEDYLVLNDIMVRTDRGTSQIDHIVLSRFGVFVIETKTYTGWIHGSEDADYWTQTVYRNKQKFRNPIKQNYGHIAALKETMPEFRDIPYHSIIVFAGDAELKNVNVKAEVVYVDCLYDTIMRYRVFPVLSDDDVKKIWSILNEKTIAGRTERKEHIREVRAVKKERQQKQDKLICPRCGGQLVKRSGKYGEFLGCSNYPKCKYKDNI